MVTLAATLYQECLSSGASQSDAWNSSSVEWLKAAQVGKLEVEAHKLSAATGSVLINLQTAAYIRG